jgi:hypothetical protein
MPSGKRIPVALVVAILLTMGLAGCVSDPEEADWKDPTQVMFDSIDVDETNETVMITFSLGDKEDMYTRASGTVRIAIFDSDDFEMLNNTFEVKAKDFESLVILGLKLSQYTQEIPFNTMEKSHDRGYDTLAGDNALHGMVWFTWKEETFLDTYDAGWLNPTIPEGLLHPNEAPEADLVVDNPGFVGMDVMANGSASTDLEGGTLDYTWDWGDGDTIDPLFASAEESHVYDVAGTYTITMNVTDPEGAEDTATFEVVIAWALDITVNGWGVVTEGDYVNQTYVELLIENAAPAEVDLPTSGMSGIMLKDASDTTVDASGTDVAIPATLAVDGDLTVMVYFDPDEGYTATKIDVWGREFTLP